jgi:hypothetical protein
LGKELQVVPGRHLDVEEHQVDGFRAHDVEGGRGVGRGQHLVVGLEGRLQSGQDRVVVVDGEDHWPPLAA